MKHQSLYTSWLRYKTLRTNIITALPIVILMPHSACNCRCVMCDIWKGNKNLKQLTEADVHDLMFSLKKLTAQVLFTGGEAILHPNFFTLCRMLKKLPIKITLITSGHAIKQHAAMIASHVDDMIISLDGNEGVHNAIRNVPNAFAKTKENIQLIKSIKPGYTIGARTVIHKLNFRVWPQIIDAAKEMGLDGISFFPADTTSPAFNHTTGNEEALQDELHIDSSLLRELHAVIEALIVQYKDDFASGYIAESPDKIRKIYAYYAAFAGLNDFPYKKCNAPWVATVIEPDGSVKPCFFHDSIGNIREASLDQVINGEKAMQFRKMLETTENSTCTRCVSPLHLGPTFNPAAY